MWCTFTFRYFFYILTVFYFVHCSVLPVKTFFFGKLKKSPLTLETTMFESKTKLTYITLFSLYNAYLSFPSALTAIRKERLKRAKYCKMKFLLLL